MERKHSMGQKYLSELRKCSSYGGLSNRELLMRIYQDIFTVPEESFELWTYLSNKKSSYSLLYKNQPTNLQQKQADWFSYRPKNCFKRVKTALYKNIAKRAMTRLKIIPTPTETNQPMFSKNKQTSSHVGKTLASTQTKTEAILIKYL